jgi:hypothetical protein
LFLGCSCILVSVFGVFVDKKENLYVEPIDIFVQDCLLHEKMKKHFYLFCLGREANCRSPYQAANERLHGLESD